MTAARALLAVALIPVLLRAILKLGTYPGGTAWQIILTLILVGIIRAERVKRRTP